MKLFFRTIDIGIKIVIRKRLIADNIIEFLISARNGFDGRIGEKMGEKSIVSF